MTEHTSLQFKREKGGRALSHADAEIAEHLILRHGTVAQPIQNEVRKRSIAPGGRDHGPARPRAPRPKVGACVTDGCNWPP